MSTPTTSAESGRPTMRLGAIALDCADPIELATFYHELTGWPVSYSSGEFAAVGTGMPYMTLHRVPDHRPPSWPDDGTPKQLHVDFVVENLDSAESFAVELGARKSGTQPEPGSWRVLTDPAGHPFCLCADFPDR